MQGMVNITKALAEENRLRVIAALKDRELCVCQITELLGLAPSTVSKHMTVLRQAGLVESWKDGRWVYYRLAGQKEPSRVGEALRWVHQWAGNTRQAQRDAKFLDDILAEDKEDLCRRQNRCGK